MENRITAIWMTREWTVLEVMRGDKLAGELHNVDSDDTSWEHDVQVRNHLGNYTWLRPVNWIEPFPTPEEAQEALNYAVKISEVWESFNSIPLGDEEPEMIVAESRTYGFKPVKYHYMKDKTPFTTCQRSFEGRALHRQKSNSHSRRYNRRKGIVVVKTA